MRVGLRAGPMVVRRDVRRTGWMTVNWVDAMVG